jgi:phage gp29-like protein
MNERHVFVSGGGTVTPRQEAFVRAVKERLRREGLIPHTVGRNTFGSDAPLKTMIDWMDRCSGTPGDGP